MIKPRHYVWSAFMRGDVLRDTLRCESLINRKQKKFYQIFKGSASMMQYSSASSHKHPSMTIQLPPSPVGIFSIFRLLFCFFAFNDQLPLFSLITLLYNIMPSFLVVASVSFTVVSVQLSNSDRTCALLE